MNYVSAELTANESNFSKQKLNDYEEAFRRIFVLYPFIIDDLKD